MQKRVALVLSLAALGGYAACGGQGSVSCPQKFWDSEEAMLKVCSGTTTVKGIDVSTYQSNVDWAKVKAAGIDFAIARVSDGLNYPDAKFAQNWTGMKAHGVIRGAYQFFRPGQDAVQQADLVLNALATNGGLVAGDLPVVMDIEVTDSQTPATIQAQMQKWLNHIEAATGHKPIIYTAAFMSSNVGTGFSAYPLWVANYGATCPTMPGGWSKWIIWQYSSTGSVNGISGNVDMDEWDGTLADLQAYTNPVGTPDAGPAHDAGVVPDAGAAHDAGAAADAGAAHDAGTVHDAGAVADAGEPADAGAIDAGAEADAGAVADAGGRGDADAGTSDAGQGGAMGSGNRPPIGVCR